MAKISTPSPVMHNMPSSKKSRTSTSQPSSRTIAFLRQYARSCHYEPRLAPAAGTMMLN